VSRAIKPSCGHRRDPRDPEHVPLALLKEQRHRQTHAGRDPASARAISRGAHRCRRPVAK
jgi:hypothetical protein